MIEVSHFNVHPCIAYSHVTKDVACGFYELGTEYFGCIDRDVL
jgi:hypothetical protein